MNSPLHSVRLRIADRDRCVLLIVGTRPECIKMAPVIRELAAQQVDTIVVNSGQHPSAVNRTLLEFGLGCDVQLGALPEFSQFEDACDHLEVELFAVVRRFSPEVVLVQGDTLTAYAGARAAYRAGSVLGHVEAGLRTDDPAEPFPEEWFRREIARYAALHFAPCRSAVVNLRAEGIDGDAIHHVGNTGIDSLLWMLRELGRATVAPSRNALVLVTLHRRENYDENAEAVCDALIELAATSADLRMLFPVHPNPRVAEPARRRLRSLAACELVEPMSYRDFIRHARQASLIVSDSGGIQEEAPHLGTPLLVPRCNTERPEALDTGFVRLIGGMHGAIAPAALQLLATPRRRALPIDDAAPFGAGDAAGKIVGVLAKVLRARIYT